jgi:threonine dehydrogenase-like Zn-dependent dehydrogenase
MEASNADLKSQFKFRGKMIPYWSLRGANSWGSFVVDNTSRSGRPRPLHPPPCPFCGIVTGRSQAERVSVVSFNDESYFITDNNNPIVHNQLLIFPCPRKDSEGFLEHRIDIVASDVELMIKLTRDGFSGLPCRHNDGSSPAVRLESSGESAAIYSRPWAAYINAFPGSGRSVQHLHINCLPAHHVPILDAEPAPWQVSRDPETGAGISRFSGTSFYGLVIEGDGAAVAQTVARLHVEMNTWEHPYNLLVYPNPAKGAGQPETRVAVLPRDQEYCEAADQRVGGLEFLTGVLIPSANRLPAMDTIQRDLTFWQSTLKTDGRLKLERRLRGTLGMPVIGNAVYAEPSAEAAGVSQTIRCQPVVRPNRAFEEAQDVLGYWRILPKTDGQVLGNVREKSSVLVRVTRASICQSDRRVLQGNKSSDIKKKASENKTLVLGHEAGGYIVDPGPWGSELEAGEKVVVLPHLTCDTCDYCRSYMQNLCRKMKHLGFHLDGSMAELMCFPYQCILPVGPDFPDDALPLVEPLACVLRALFRIKEQLSNLANSSAQYQHSANPFTIYGGGPMGCLTARAVQRFWPDIEVRIVEPLKARCEAVRRSGIADLVIENIREGEENHISFVASSKLQAALGALASTWNGGTVVLFSGINTDDLAADDQENQARARNLESIHRGEGDVIESFPLGKRYRLVGSSGYNYDDARRSQYELLRHYEHYARIQNVRLEGLDASQAFYILTGESRRFNTPAVEALLSADGVYDAAHGKDIAETIKPLLRL